MTCRAGGGWRRASPGIAAAVALAVGGCTASPIEPRLPGYAANGLERGAGAAAEPSRVGVGPLSNGPAGAMSNSGPTSLGPWAIGPGAVGPGLVGQGASGGYNAY